jgi:voltage-gated potassium channel
MDNEIIAQDVEHERRELLLRIDRGLETPMVVLGFVWLALLVWELIDGLSPLLETLGLVIWGIFVLHFALEFLLAPRKGVYLKSHWLTALALLVPALRTLRVIRVIRVFRAARGVRLIRVVTSLNRSMRALGSTLERRGFGYVVALTCLVTVSGAAGMFAFENEAPGGLATYSEALWWTSMIMTTMGSAYWPQTAEGRVLCMVLALYAFGVFGYVTATLATFFVGRDAEAADGEIAGASAVQALRHEIAALRADLSQTRRPGGGEH